MSSADTPVAGVDVTTLSDDDLSALGKACSAESVRRSNLSTIPTQVSTLASVYKGAGGDLSNLTSAVQAVGDAS